MLFNPKVHSFCVVYLFEAFFFIGKEKYHRLKNVNKEHTKEAQEAKGERKS